MQNGTWVYHVLCQQIENIEHQHGSPSELVCVDLNPSRTIPDNKNGMRKISWLG